MTNGRTLFVASLRKLIDQTRVAMIVFVICGCLGYAASFLLPVSYQTSGTFVPSSSISGGGGFGAASGLLAAAAQFGVGLGTEDPSALFPAILHSKAIADTLLARRFATTDGRQVRLIDYVLKGKPVTVRSTERARRLVLFSTLKYSFDRRSGVSKLFVQLGDPRLAAEVANAAIAELDRFNRTAKSANATQQVRFIASRLDSTRLELAAGEDALATFKTRNRGSEDSPLLAVEQQRLEREVDFAENVYSNLRTQYEVARIEEVKTLPVITVLDSATPPTRRFMPRRGVVALALAMLGGAVALAWTTYLGRAAAADLEVR